MLEQGDAKYLLTDFQNIRENIQFYLKQDFIHHYSNQRKGEQRRNQRGFT